MGNLRDWLSSNMFLRNMLADFGYRSAYTGDAGSFIPYFQYRIGPYQRDFYLHFPKEPFAVRYRNEVFNKLFEYEADDIYKYLEFHYQAFPEKNAFVLFLDRQLTERLKKPHSKQRRIKLESASDWVGEKRELLKLQSIVTKEEISRDLRRVLDSEAAGNKEEARESLDNLTTRLDAKVSDAVDRLENATALLPTGNIALNNQDQLEKVVQVLYLLQSVTNPAKADEKLFRRFNHMDLAAILRHHFREFADKKPNTVEKNAHTSIDNLRANDPKAQKLITAMADFFYR